MLCYENNNSIICPIPVAYCEPIVKAGPEHSDCHQEDSVTFSVSGTSLAFLLEPHRIDLFVGFIIIVHIGNSFVYLVVRVSIDRRAHAPSHSSPAPELFQKFIVLLLFFGHISATLQPQLCLHPTVYFRACSICFKQPIMPTEDRLF